MASEIGLPLLGVFVKPVTAEQVRGLVAQWRARVSARAAGRAAGAGYAPSRGDVMVAYADKTVRVERNTSTCVGR